MIDTGHSRPRIQPSFKKIRRESAHLTNMIKRTLFLAGEAACENERVGHRGLGGAGGRAPGRQASPRAPGVAPEPQEPVVGQGGAGGACGGSTGGGEAHLLQHRGSPQSSAGPGSTPEPWNCRPEQNHTLQVQGQRRNLQLRNRWPRWKFKDRRLASERQAH